MRDICVIQDESSENLALIGEILGAAGVNIEGLSLTTCNGQSVIHFVGQDIITARHILENSGIRIREISEVFVLHKDKECVTGKPGSLEGICRLFAENEIVSNSENGDVSAETLFHYHQDREIISADYHGGKIIKGHLIGKILDNGQLEWHPSSKYMVFQAQKKYRQSEKGTDLLLK